MKALKHKSIIDCLDDPHLFRPFLKPASSWASWRTPIKAMFGIAMTEDEQKFFSEHTGRTKLFDGPVNEAWFLCGRRSGKTYIAALVAAYMAAFSDYRPHLQPGELALISIIACDKSQAAICLRYIRGLFTNIPLLKGLVKRETGEGLELHSRVMIQVNAASYRGVRGYSLAALIMDETAFFRDENSQNPDSEIYNAAKPGLSNLPNSKLIGLSTPYSKRGLLWRMFNKHYGNDQSRVLFWRASTAIMNPSLDPSVVTQAMEDDPIVASAEYEAQFRSDVTAFIDGEKLQSLVISGRRQNPPIPGVLYAAFTDPSGGSSDSFTLCVAHAENGRVVIDCLLEQKPPFSPEQVVGQFADTMRQYGINTVHGDRYAGQWPVEGFAKAGINYYHCPLSASELYLGLLPLINSGQIELLDNSRALAQLAGLERKVSGGGRELISHGPGQHDDLANSLAGAAWAAKTSGAMTANDGELAFNYQRTEPQQGMVRREDDLTDLGSVAYTTRARYNFNF